MPAQGTRSSSTEQAEPLPWLFSLPSEGVRPRTELSISGGWVFLGPQPWTVPPAHHCPGMLSWSCCEVLGGQVEDVALHGPLPLAPVPPDLSLDLHQPHGWCWHPETQAAPNRGNWGSRGWGNCPTCGFGAASGCPYARCGAQGWGGDTHSPPH